MISQSVFLCGEFKLENIYSGVHFRGKILVVLFIAGTYFCGLLKKTPKSQTCVCVTQ